ncbi:MAG TPA: class IV adenylate cyclase [Thermoplasmata archaeon]|nr:class IV adenylate cyclase [Thermoplasmata archaeon]
MIEVEAKAPVKNPISIKNSLIKIGSSFVESRKERDEYFQHPCRDFTITDEALRIRRVGKQVLMTYKGPKLDQKTKTREEITLSISKQYSLAKSLIQRLGFKKAIEVVKQREVYRLGKLEICLDDVQGLGTYLEIEVRVAKDFENAKKKILLLLDKLKLKETTRQSYVELLNEKKVLDSKLVNYK